jgi:DNA ligase 1
MRKFAELYERIDSTTSTNEKVEAMVDYFQAASSADAAWALYYLTGRRLKRFISSRSLRDWTLELTGVREWLYDECYSSVGDTAECCSLLLDSYDLEQADRTQTEDYNLSLDQWMLERIKPLAKKEEPEQKEIVTAWWKNLDRHGIFVLNKLLTGSFRVGVSQSLVARALAKVATQEVSEIAHRLMGDWEPTPDWYERLTSPDASSHSLSTPYPFYLASPIEKDVTELGDVSEWQAEWKWDGIRAQVIRRGSDVFIWSRGEELITDRFPEITQAALTLPEGTVIDGEILAMKGNTVLPFAVLQKRIGRKTLSKNILAEAPAALMVYDLIELGGQDLRQAPMSERRGKLEAILENTSAVFHLSPTIHFDSWDELTEHRKGSRERSVEGIMLKRLSSPYQAGRKRGDWWKWKIDPLTIDAVLIYAQAGSGRRANLFTDYTFALWEGDRLMPIAKAYSGLSDEEIGKLDHWIRRNTQDKFGPVRSVTPFHVFELAFEGINASPRHKSGVAVRFPRILRWRHDKKIADADKLDTLKAMIDEPGTSPQYDLSRDPALEKA